MSSQNLKAENLKQWDNDPCGAVYAKDIPPGSREFFQKITAERYRDYPWIKTAAQFADFTGQKILEIGCGMGIDLMEFARNGAEVCGLDQSEKSLELAQKSFAIFNLKGELQQADASQKIPYPDENFDLVYSCGVLHHIPQVEKAVAEIYRVLKPGGKIKIFLYYRDSIYFWYRLCFYLGILKGNYFRGLNTAQLLSRYIEYSQTGALPLVRVYSKGQAGRLLRQFTGLKMKIYHLKPEDIPIFGAYFSPGLLQKLEPHFGWYLCLDGMKK